MVRWPCIASMETKRNRDPIFERADLQAYAERYVSRSEAAAPLASPNFASLHGLPPLLLQVGSYELLLDDAVRFAAAAATADVDVTLEVTSRATHVFQLGVGDSPAADVALGRAAQFLNRHLLAD